MGAFWRMMAGDSQLRWIGPENGAIHLATAAIVNAVWDLWGKSVGKPVWKLLADKKRVLITGAGGRIGSSLAGQLKERYSLRLHYFPTLPEQPPVDDVVQGNISIFPEIAPAMSGINAVVHLAGNPSTQASWDSVRDNNIEGTYNVFEAARQAGVQKIVFATTNHVMGMYDRHP